MKKFITIFIFGYLSLIILFTGIYTFPAYALSYYSNYYRVITDDTPFFANQYSSTPLFYLPYTYYVKVLSTQGDFYHVECYGNGLTPALDGFVPKDMLYLDNLEVSSPYLSLTIQTSQTALLYSSPDANASIQYLFAERDLMYYGKYQTENEIMYYVSYNGKLGYVKESSVYPFTISNHPNALTFIPPEMPSEPPQEESSPTTKTDLSALKITIVVCLVFAGAIALIFLSKKRPNGNVAISYYDENDYE